MYKIDLNNPCHIYFIGIGGISMSGFAEYLHTKGFAISGSDSHKTKITKHLEDLGIKVYLGQRASNISSDIDLVVYTAAISKDNQEFQEVIAKNLPILTRAEMIGQLMYIFNNSMAVSGTHGKTTTTSMLSTMFLDANLDPTISVGGILDAIGGNIRIGQSEHFITEACEYTNTFLAFHPKRAIILNIDEDHLDFFKDLEDIRNSFHLFVKGIPADGQLFINGDIDRYEEIVKDVECQVLTYGVLDPQYNNNVKTYDYGVDHIQFDEMSRGSFDLYHQGTLLGHVQLNVIGLYNIYNALSAISLALESGITLDIIQSSVLAFTGAQRRFEHKGTIGGVTIIDDYAHHPTAIEATLTAVKNYPHNKVWCVFQPHTYTRTKRLLKEFAASLCKADVVVLSDIYPAREIDPGDISSKDLAYELEQLGKEVHHFESFDEIENFLLSNCMNGDLLITMGAGDIVIVGESILGN